MNHNLRLGLFSSALVAVGLALLSFIIIAIRIYKMRQHLRQHQAQLLPTLPLPSDAPNLPTPDPAAWEQILTKLRATVSPTLAPEVLEFCINSCIRNQFHRVLLTSVTGPYEALALAHLARVSVELEAANFDYQLYHRLQLAVEPPRPVILTCPDAIVPYDAIFALDQAATALETFVRYEPYLRPKGMMVFANTKAARPAIRPLIKKIQQINYKYDILKWHNGFVIIVKT